MATKRNRSARVRAKLRAKHRRIRAGKENRMRKRKAGGRLKIVKR
jgi:hypothetical protein